MEGTVGGSHRSPQLVVRCYTKVYTLGGLGLLFAPSGSRTPCHRHDAKVCGGCKPKRRS